jgi:hypothetical protein
MRVVTKHYIRATLLTAIFAVSVAGQTAADTASVRADFESRVRQYVELRKRMEVGLPALPDNATPEQINTRKVSLLKVVREARKNAKTGDLITPQVKTLISEAISSEYKGPDLANLRKTVIEAETNGVPVKVNAEYPESKEKLEMPPKLLMALPELPEILRYRFVGKNMLIVDKENSLIIDFAADVIP